MITLRLGKPQKKSGSLGTPCGGTFGMEVQILDPVEWFNSGKYRYIFTTRTMYCESKRIWKIEHMFETIKGLQGKAAIRKNKKGLGHSLFLRGTTGKMYETTLSFSTRKTNTGAR